MEIIKKLLNKRGVEDVTKLSSDEKQDIDRWQKILSEGEITVDKIKAFCDNEIGKIEKNWKDLNNSKEKNERLIIMHTVYSSIIEAIEAPQKQKESLEKYLSQLIEA